MNGLGGGLAGQSALPGSAGGARIAAGTRCMQRVPHRGALRPGTLDLLGRRRQGAHGWTSWRCSQVWLLRMCVLAVWVSLPPWRAHPQQPAPRSAGAPGRGRR